MKAKFGIHFFSQILFFCATKYCYSNIFDPVSFKIAEPNVREIVRSRKITLAMQIGTLGKALFTNEGLSHRPEIDD